MAEIKLDTGNARQLGGISAPNFQFEKFGIGVDSIKQEVEKLTNGFHAIPHEKLLNKLLDEFDKVDFREQAGFTEDNERLGRKHFLVSCIEEVLRVAQQNNWGICKHLEFVYLYNGAYWNLLGIDEVQSFLGDAAQRMGIDKFDARYHSFRDQLLKQFFALANLPKPEQPTESVLINLKNGTFEIDPSNQFLRPPQPSDFITYQLPFEFNQQASAPLFQTYLDRVLPDKAKQLILAEYLGYLFIKPRVLKLEKTLLLYGTGANGKSVFFDVVNALLGGDENVSSYSLHSLTNESGYYRAKLANKLLNYATEINGKLDTSLFKQLVSGEPIEARLPYGEPFTVSNYAKLIFNCNELPKEVEQTHGYFRRFLIIPFDVTIPESEQDKELAQKIIQKELSGVFNWVLDGLQRLMNQKQFTYCESVTRQLERYKKESDSVQMFLEEEGYVRSSDNWKSLKELFFDYRNYCHDGGYHPCSIRTFSERVRNADFIVERRSLGNVVFVERGLS